MKKQFLRFPSLLVMALALFAASCEKEGPAGPAGEQGEQGEKGDKGDKGEAGDQGETGTANVIYSDWLDVTYALNNDSTAYISSITAPSLVDSILTAGQVKLYMNWGSAAAPEISPLPYFDGDFIINPTYALQEIFLVANVNASTFTDNGVKRLQYRYVLVPGGTEASRASVDWNDYNAVKVHLGLKD